MKLYTIKTNEIYTATYEVVADSADEAIAAVHGGRTEKPTLELESLDPLTSCLYEGKIKRGVMSVKSEPLETHDIRTMV